MAGTPQAARKQEKGKHARADSHYSPNVHSRSRFGDHTLIAKHCSRRDGFYPREIEVTGPGEAGFSRRRIERRS
jgi:hypothetical protein